MSKKHFKALAEMLVGLKGRIAEDARETVAEEVARVCRDFSYKFDKNLFLLAAGIARRG